MKMVKSLLLGAAAGIVAVAGAQAADLPVKAKPVQYVKICSLYGAGFYYIPGTDTCIKVGGWMQAEYTWGTNGNVTGAEFGNNQNNRTTNNSTWRSRAYITVDAREQTPYGTVRSYIAEGLIDNDIGNTALGFHANRAFIQWAGFTFGTAVSFFDFYSVGAMHYLASFPTEDTGGGGWKVLGYTAQFGNGFSGTIAAESRRETQIVGQTAATAGVNTGTVIPGGVVPAAGYEGWQQPDIVGNLRVDQAWGSAQIMGALHQVATTYYAATAGGPNAEAQGHPGDKEGFAIGAGLKLNLPMLGKGDWLQAEANYAEGASMYNFTLSNFNYANRSGNNMAFGVLSDAVYGGTPTAGNNTDLNLTSTWTIQAGYEHHWNDQWKTSVYGGYAEVNYNDQANAILCNLEASGNGNGGVGTGALATPGCDNDWNFWWVGSRTQWNVTSNFYLGVDVLYQKMNSADFVGGVMPAIVNATQTSTPAINTVSDRDNLAIDFRVHHDFYP